MSCSVGLRRGSDPALLWLWCRPVAAALIQPLAREPPYATGAALKRQKNKEEDPEGQRRSALPQVTGSQDQFSPHTQLPVLDIEVRAALPFSTAAPGISAKSLGWERNSLSLNLF